MNPKTEAIYFTSLLEDEEPESNALIFINYGYGAYRWEKCKVVGYIMRVSETSSNLNTSKKPRKKYVAQYRGSIIHARDFQLQMDPAEMNSIGEYDEKKAKRVESMRRKREL